MRAFGFIDGILGGVFDEFGGEGLGKVDVQVVSEEKSVVGDVSEFVGYVFALIGYGFVNFVGGLPEENLLQLRGFNRQTGSEVFRVVELLPVTGIAEGDDFFG